MSLSRSQAGSFYDQDGYEAPRQRELAVIDVASGTVTRLTSGSSELHAVTFTPEGDRILYWRSEPDADGSLWSVNADGSGDRLLINGTNEFSWQGLPAGSR